nr:MAG TPA: hypothetical protein [Caudoviricetes sp.]DAR56260.1 MAG TPA: hypothetical protein [Caudoviricetes sp.]
MLGIRQIGRERNLSRGRSGYVRTSPEEMTCVF